MMAQISSKLRNWRNPATGEEGLSYWCQGCEMSHVVKTAGAPVWSWNGDTLAPVFVPSVVSTTGHHATNTPAEDCEYCKDARADDEPSPCQRCHTFVGCNGAQPGEVIFLGDCTHALAGQVLPFPDLPAHMRDQR